MEVQEIFAIWLKPAVGQLEAISRDQLSFDDIITKTKVDRTGHTLD